MSKPMTLAESSIIPPTLERMQHDPIVLSDQQIADSDGNIGSPWREVGTIALLFERKAIKNEHVLAAFAYMDDFDTAKMYPVRASPMEIMGKGREELSNRVMRAKNRLWNARKALGLGTAVERSAYAILGMRYNFKEWVDREAGVFSEQTAKRLLIAALHDLVDHYGLVTGKK